MEVVNNKKEFRFEITLTDGEKAVLVYRWLKGNMVLMHTVVPESGRGKGVGAALVKYVLEHIRASGLKMIVYCPFVAKYLESHPEYNDLVADPNSR